MLNTVDDRSIIAANQAQDMLNVDITPGGRSVKKREGFSLDNTFSVSTSPIHGAYSFFDANGNQVRLWGQDVGLWASVSGATYVKVSTGTLNATWQCTDYLGFAYCVNSSRDMPIKTNGTTAGTTYQPTIPAGTMIASTPERLLVSGTLANPQRLYYSGASNLTDFTVGSQPSSSSYEDITAPGSALTHLAYIYGRWLWWKDQSLGFLIGTDQTNLQLVTVSNTIGTFDNEHVYDSGLTYFRANDSHFYTYDGSQLQRISRDITPTVLSANRRKSASWAQSSQTDFANGTIVPSPNLSTSISPGDVIVSSFTVTENSSTSWSAGTTSNTTVWVSSITLATNSAGTVNNPSFETSGGDFAGASWTNSNSNTFARSGSTPLVGCTGNPQAGSFYVYGQPGTGSSARMEVIDLNSNVLATGNITATGDCSYQQTTISDPGNSGKRVKFRLRVSATGSNCSGTPCYLTTNDSYIFGGSISVYGGKDGGNNWLFDNIQSGSSTITTGSFTSQAFDTSFTSSTVQATAFSYTANTTTPTFIVQHATSTNGSWATLLSTTSSNAVGNKFLRYVVTFPSVGSTDNALSSFNSITLLARSTGTYYSAVNNAPNITSWSNIGITDSIPGASTITYYSRASTSAFTVTSATPTWIVQAKNSNVAASTGTYFQLRADFRITAATETPSMSDFTFNWFEGSATDKMYGAYYNYAIWFSVSLGSTTTTNNRILRWDLLNQGWNVYDIPSNGFLLYNSSLYIGDSTVGRTYKFGGVNSDNNVAINSYWKSKEFFGSSPFQDEDIRQMSWYCAASSGTTLSVTYQVNESTQTTYSINLYDSTSNVIRSNRNLPQGTVANVFNVKIGDNSTNPAWNCFAGQYWYVTRPWNVKP